MNESEIQKAVAKHYKTLENLCKQFTFFSVAGGSVRVPPHIGKRLKDQGVKAGVHDLVFLFAPAKVVLIELKTLKGNLSDAQKAFHGIVSKLGHASYAIKVYDANDAINQINGLLAANGLRLP